MSILKPEVAETPVSLTSQVQFVMPSAAADHLQRQIAQGSEGIDEVIESLSQVDSEEAKAWKMEDETKVKPITNEIHSRDFKRSCTCYVICMQTFSQVFSCFSEDWWGDFWSSMCSAMSFAMPKEVFDPGSQPGPGVGHLRYLTQHVCY